MTGCLHLHKTFKTGSPVAGDAPKSLLGMRHIAGSCCYHLMCVQSLNHGTWDQHQQSTTLPHAKFDRAPPMPSKPRCLSKLEVLRCFELFGDKCVGGHSTIAQDLHATPPSPSPPPLPPPRPRMSCLYLFRQSLLIKQEIAGGFCSVRGSSSLFGGLDPIIAAMGRRLGLTFKWAKASFWQVGGKSSARTHAQPGRERSRSLTPMPPEAGSQIDRLAVVAKGPDMNRAAWRLLASEQVARM